MLVARKSPKRLITSGSSPLYGTDIEELRADLWRIRQFVTPMKGARLSAPLSGRSRTRSAAPM